MHAQLVLCGQQGSVKYRGGPNGRSGGVFLFRAEDGIRVEAAWVEFRRVVLGAVVVVVRTPGKVVAARSPGSSTQKARLTASPVRRVPSRDP